MDYTSWAKGRHTVMIEYCFILFYFNSFLSFYFTGIEDDFYGIVYRKVFERKLKLFISQALGD